MSDLAIRVENLGKVYRIGKPNRRPRSLAGRSMDLLLSPVRYLLDSIQTPGPRDTIWALKDVSLDVKRGEVVGIVGRNGAGKSTLLKILSRITEPTTGRSELYGRVASLLEVGTGFHPELTGRENIFMNGSMLGMSQMEIRGKFDEIVDFSGVEKFIDTPVKYYSSGMYLRLAFAVAAHLEAEILLVDEVLAVGDAEFQKRCLGKMEELTSRQGRTVLLVSHNMPAVSRHCPRAVLLEQGGILMEGETAAVVERYLGSITGARAEVRWESPSTAPGDGVARILSVRSIDEHRKTVSSIDVRKPVGIEIVFQLLHDGASVVPCTALWNSQGVHIFNAVDTDPVWTRPCRKGAFVVSSWIPANLLNEDTYIASALVLTLVPAGKTIKHAEARDAVSFQVFDPLEGGSARGAFRRQWGGAISPLLHWTTTYESME